ncbi:hypothetical protein OIU74_020771 [Salix koriyanagi]|uniref:Uncharacterized protein n=1 Tax=Salix koriyanagi TaxID=2511006 RepID=A0A9Q0P6N2_9ROSI|nr:hypothetical protein OIU74_020771 [Salix koriyanagi]
MAVLILSRVVVQLHTILGKLVVQPCTKDSDDEGISTSNVMLINPFAQALVGGASANDDKVSGAASWGS